MSKKNQTPEVTEKSESTEPRKAISLRREKLKALRVNTGVATGVVVGIGASYFGCGKGGPGGCPQSLINCTVSKQP